MQLPLQSTRDSRRGTELRRWLGSARGQSTAEFALAVPVFLALLFGLIEMGMLYKTYGAYKEAAIVAVHAGSEVGATDADALQALQSTLSTENLNNISSVQIYDATAGAPITATVSYTYSPALKTIVCASTGVSPVTATCPGPWGPSVRNTATGSLDSMGIRVAYAYYSLRGVFPALHITQTAAAQLEPSTYSGP